MSAELRQLDASVAVPRGAPAASLALGPDDLAARGRIEWEREADELGPFRWAVLEAGQAVVALQAYDDDPARATIVIATDGLLVPNTIAILRDGLGLGAAALTLVDSEPQPELSDADLLALAEQLSADLDDASGRLGAALGTRSLGERVFAALRDGRGGWARDVLDRLASGPAGALTGVHVLSAVSVRSDDPDLVFRDDHGPVGRLDPQESVLDVRVAGLPDAFEGQPATLVFARGLTGDWSSGWLSSDEPVHDGTAEFRFELTPARQRRIAGLAGPVYVVAGAAP